jgi:hypothetical protein
MARVVSGRRAIGALVAFALCQLHVLVADTGVSPLAAVAPRIIGGTPVPFGSFGFQVNIQLYVDIGPGRGKVVGVKVEGGRVKGA